MGPKGCKLTGAVRKAPRIQTGWAKLFQGSAHLCISIPNVDCYKAIVAKYSRSPKTFSQYNVSEDFVRGKGFNRNVFLNYPCVVNNNV